MADERAPQGAGSVSGDPAHTGWVIPFTDDELTAIYDAIEEASPRDDPRVEAALERVIDKICATAVGNPKPKGAL